MKKKILIVDDEPNILVLMQQALELLEEEYGIELLTAKDGTEAIEIIKKEEPDLVFLDVMMPKMSGLEVCNIVKRNLELQNIYIVMLTAKGQEFDRQSGLAVGADLYITKPFRPREILAKAKDILQLAASGQLIETPSPEQAIERWS